MGGISEVSQVFFSQLAKLGGHHLIFSGELSFCVTAVYQGDQVDLYSDIYI